MSAFADLLETVTPAASTDAARNLTTTASVKTALKIANSDSDTLIADLIPRVSKLIVEDCRLDRSAAGAVPTFARETLRATWYVANKGRGCELWLPWRPPFASLTSVVEDGVTLTVNTDHVVVGNGRVTILRRMSSDTPTWWSCNKIVVTWLGGFASVMSSNIERDLEAAAIEQIRGALFGADRDPAIRSESTPDVGMTAYSVPGGDTMGANVLFPAVRSMLAGWRNSAP